MIAQIRAELLKIRSTRTVRNLCLGMDAPIDHANAGERDSATAHEHPCMPAPWNAPDWAIPRARLGTTFIGWLSEASVRPVGATTAESTSGSSAAISRPLGGSRCHAQGESNNPA